MNNYIESTRTFSLNSLPDLDVITLAALELFEGISLPKVNFAQFKRPLVVGSGNAAVVGKLLFSDADAVFADESLYKQKLDSIAGIDGVFLISASGAKHAISIAEELKRRRIKTVLLTNNEDAPAKQIVGIENVFVFPKNREPYTYNTSTYMGMLLAKTNEDTNEIKVHIQTEVLPLIPADLILYDAFYLIVPEEFTDVREMFATKFNELFGPKLVARVFTLEQTKHAKTVINSNKELFVSFGVENNAFGRPENRLYITLPKQVNYAGMMATGYVLIGNIQKQFHAYYKERVAEYCKETSEIFGSTISPIVE